jgi:hypothetical protein
MRNFIKNIFKKPTPAPEPVQVQEVEQPKKVKKKPEPSPKEKANLNNEPYVSILKIDLDPNNINSGAFELDWNDKFILNLIKSGYKLKQEDTESEIVDRWFQTICRNIALEVYEQEQADPEKRSDIRVIRQRDIGDGRTEVS